MINNNNNPDFCLFKVLTSALNGVQELSMWPAVGSRDICMPFQLERCCRL